MLWSRKQKAGRVSWSRRFHRHPEAWSTVLVVVFLWRGTWLIGVLTLGVWQPGPVPLPTILLAWVLAQALRVGWWMRQRARALSVVGKPSFDLSSRDGWREVWRQYREYRGRISQVRSRHDSACVWTKLVNSDSKEVPELRRVRATIDGDVTAQVNPAAKHGVSLDAFAAVLPRLAEIHGCTDVAMRRTSVNTADLTFFFTDPIGRVLSLDDMPDGERDQVVFGVKRDGQPASWKWNLSVLIGGLTEHGKSNLIHCGVASLIKKNVPYWLAISDPKAGMELAEYGRNLGKQGDCGKVYKYAASPEESEKMLKDVLALIQSRGRVFAERGLRSWSPSDEFPLVVVIIDELGELQDTTKAGSSSALAGIVRLGRAVGVVAWIGSQAAQVDTIGRLRSFIPQTVSLAVRGPSDAAMFFSADAIAAGARPHEIHEPGVGYSMSASDQKASKFRAAYVKPEDYRIIAAGHLPPAMKGVHAEKAQRACYTYHYFGLPGYAYDDRAQTMVPHGRGGRQLLYVGKAFAPGDRLAQHRKTDWWMKFVDVKAMTTEMHVSEEAALAAEASQIAALLPVFNEKHNLANPARKSSKLRLVKGAAA